ncbi:Rne/Rng family ribonuclease [Persicimonas caeni]|uniref:Rne/Rng family ribonuclease n=1 Tax=Persicimonas caeni TaxID=2292766 RepID=A0A4Y6PTV1_PERCE|nr:Rne/Rng family ribonuclease [Persicimonas caeni]QDG51663.1 Rne/Rng family ribonuclease [Persicimonas caeni]QED32884.1 Rne/Rng family ribonuclease [Persicimonas caeni]
MSDLLVVNSTSAETRVALVEDGIISEFYIERKRDRDVVGNIYKGKVVRVLPGMQASFIDVAQQKAGFLHVSDFYDFEEDLAAFVDEDAELWPPPSRSQNKKRVNIQDVLNEGEEIMVQVSKEPIGTKGARLTSHISIPGRFLVFMPTVSHIGISRRISSDKKRKRLRKIVEEQRQPGTGFIVRTVSENASEEMIRREIDVLTKQWEEILEKCSRVKAPYLLYEEPDLLLRVARDLFTPNLERLVVDDKEAYERVRNYVEKFMPEYVDFIDLYDYDEPIFDAFGIEPEINGALSRHVELESGGELVFDKTEALTSIDINTGKFVGSSSLEETIFKTNLEAVDEIVYQLRLRNIGGIIIIDFIDMEEAGHREKVYRALEEALKKDRVTTNALAISDFGLVEMTRKRVRESLHQFLCEPCEYCDSRGFVKSKETVAYELIRELKREIPLIKEEDIYIQASPQVIQVLRGVERKALDKLAKDAGKKFHYKSQSDRHMESFEIAGAS